MRVPKWMVVSAIGGIVMLSACAGYSSPRMGVQAQFGPGIDIYGYSADTYGDWHSSYRQWTPTIVYESNGQYYPNNIAGARQVQVYRSQTGYFLPPRDQEWARTEKRFNAKRLPNDVDYSRAKPRP